MLNESAPDDSHSDEVLPPSAGLARARSRPRTPVSELSERLLRLLDAHRVLTTRQLMVITAAPERTTEYRMAALAARGLVGRVRPPAGRGSSPWHWWLTPAGARLVTGTACAADRGGPNPLFVRHAAATADVWIALTQTGPTVGLGLQRWWRDNEGWTEWQPPGWGYGGRVRRITPDAAAHLTVNTHMPIPTPIAGDGEGDWDGVVGAVLVEVDLATMTQQRLGYKLARYRDYAADQAWRGRHPHCPVLLVLTTTPARAATFLRGAAKMLPAPARVQSEEDWPYEAGRLVVAACGHVRDPQVAVRERVWQLPGDTAEITLTDRLTDRVQVASRAHHIDVAAARHAAVIRWQNTVDSFAADGRAPAAFAGDPAARQVLRLLQTRGVKAVTEWVAGAGQVGVVLVGWWQPYAADRYRPVGPPPAEVAAALAADYPGCWQTQAGRLAAAAGPVAAQAPVWHAAAVRLLAGQLLTDNDVERAVTAFESPAQAQHRLWHPPEPEPVSWQHPAAQPVDYPARRQQAVQAMWDGLSRRERWRSSQAELAARYDTQFLHACPVCGLLIPTPVPDQGCPACGTSWAHDYPAAGDVPAVHAALTAVLDGAVPVPAAAAVPVW